MDILDIDIARVCRDVDMSSILGGAASVFMVVGGIIPYVPQYMQIARSQNAKGFSTFVCLTLLVANILRITFWFGHPFEVPLLVQSVIMIMAMLLMVRLCVRVKYHASSIEPFRQRSFFDMDPAYFWQWTDFTSYCVCMLTFTLICGGSMRAFGDNVVFVETLGLVALMTEAALGIPQFLANYRNKSTAGMNEAMVCLWLCGDVFKTVYFVLRMSPLQFVLCGSIQVTVDLLILWQMFWYRSLHGKLLKAVFQPSTTK